MHTTAYLDVPNQAPPQVSRPGSPTAPPVDDPITNSYVSPHTGQLRPSIPSVKLAPFTEVPPPRSKTVYLSAAEKHQLLKRREENWDTLSAERIRKFTVQGEAGVYELQEGIFLICDNYVELRDSLVCSDLAWLTATFQMVRLMLTIALAGQVKTLGCPPDTSSFEYRPGSRGTYYPDKIRKGQIPII